MRREAAPPGTIEAFTPRGFRVGGIDYPGGIMVSAGGAELWPGASVDALSAADFARVSAPLLILGTGRTLRRPSVSLLAALAARAIAVEPMDSRAAARTYNLLLAEGRDVAAALLPL